MEVQMEKEYNYTPNIFKFKVQIRMLYIYFKIFKKNLIYLII
jgi:hypothetical protein